MTDANNAITISRNMNCHRDKNDDSPKWTGDNLPQKMFFTSFYPEKNVFFDKL